jgi:hypothetical protein
MEIIVPITFFSECCLEVDEEKRSCDVEFVAIFQICHRANIRSVVDLPD